MRSASAKEWEKSSSGGMTPANREKTTSPAQKEKKNPESSRNPFVGGDRITPLAGKSGSELHWTRYRDHKQKITKGEGGHEIKNRTPKGRELKQRKKEGSQKNWGERDARGKTPNVLPGVGKGNRFRRVRKKHWYRGRTREHASAGTLKRVGRTRKGGRRTGN